MKTSVIAAVLIVGASVVFCCSFFWDKPSEPDYERIADDITASVIKKIQKEKNLVAIGTGGGMLHDIKMMAISFDYYQEVDISEARKLLLYSVEEYLAAINSDEKVRPYLHNYPFTAKNIKIRIFFSKTNGRDVSFGELCGASALEGAVIYYANNQNGYTLDKLHRETYEEALQIVKNGDLNKYIFEISSKANCEVESILFARCA